MPNENLNLEQMLQQISEQIADNNTNLTEQLKDLISEQVSDLKATVERQGKALEQQSKAIQALLDNDIGAAEKLASQELSEKTSKKKNVEIYVLNERDNSLCDLADNGDIKTAMPIDIELNDCLKAGAAYIDTVWNKTVVPVFDEKNDLIGVAVADGNDIVAELEDVVKNSTAGKAILGNLQDARDKLTTERYIEMAVKDPLTKLNNKNGYEHYVQSYALEMLRSGQPMCAIMIDGDKFKEINEEYGHSAGDKVLQTIADIMKEVSGERDCVVRIGGDEFFILAQCDPATAYELAEAVRISVEETVIPVVDRDSHERVNISTTVSAGVTEIPPDIALEASRIIQKEIDPDKKEALTKAFAKGEFNHDNVHAYIEHFRTEADRLLDEAKKGYGIDDTGRAEGRNIVTKSYAVEEAVKERRNLLDLNLAADMEEFMYRAGEYHKTADKQSEFVKLPEEATGLELNYWRNEVVKILYNALEKPQERQQLEGYFKTQVNLSSGEDIQRGRDLLKSLQNYGRPSMALTNDTPAKKAADKQKNSIEMDR